MVLVHQIVTSSGKKVLSNLIGFVFVNLDIRFRINLAVY